MKLPRVRFTIRRLLAIVAVALGFLADGMRRARSRSEAEHRAAMAAIRAMIGARPTGARPTGALLPVAPDPPEPTP